MAAERAGEQAALIPAQPPASRRPKVWLLADRRGWAYDELCHGVADAIGDQFECRIAYVAEQPDLSAWDFDLVLVCFWGETWHQRFVEDPRRVVKLVCSHRWQEASYQHLSPGAFVSRHLADAGTIGATSLRLAELLRPERPVMHTPEGVDVARFATATACNDAVHADRELTFGWAGNIDDACKGVRDLLQPAAAGFDLKIAGGDLDTDAVDAFYRDIDVIVVASSLEGQPRPLLEGMASGCFVISTDVGIAPELITHNDNGLLVERSEAALRAALHWCRCNPKQVRAAGQRNRDLMQASRTWRTLAPTWRALLTEAWRTLPTTANGDLATCSPTATTSDLIDQCKQDYARHLDAVHDDGPDQNASAAANTYYRCELLPLLPSTRAARVLDVGCGYGLLLEFLHGQGYRDLTGVELDPQLQQRAQSRLGGRATIHPGDAVAWLQNHPASFDVITAYDILEHFPLEGAAAFATAIRFALRPGGVAIFRTPNMANVLGAYSRFMDLTHQAGFTEQSAAQLLRVAGYRETRLLVPDFSGEPSLASGVDETRRFHRQLFAQQDRSTPKCFDKNLVMAARAVVPVTTEARSGQTTPVAGGLQ